MRLSRIEKRHDIGDVVGLPQTTQHRILEGTVAECRGKGGRLSVLFLKGGTRTDDGASLVWQADAPIPTDAHGG